MTEFYPVFYAVDVPTELCPNGMLDELVISSKEAINRIGGVGQLCILQSTSISNINSGSTAPIQPFTSPFLNQDLDAIHKLYRENIQSKDDWTTSTFAIIDEKTVSDKTILLACSLREGLETRRSDFYASLFELLSLEMGTWLFEDDDLNQNGVLTRETCENRLPQE
ncbi:hypothetical protein MMC14_003257 [Varicellaria rhodocarpa]|nr:hypothetical protein [Varicellaria rhodocarpa]